jgi:hypothetical protein
MKSKRSESKKQLAERHFGALFQKLQDDGYLVDPPGYERLCAWNTVLLQINLASHILKRWKARAHKFGNIEDSFDVTALLSSFVITYARCFASSGKDRVKLDANRVFAGTPITRLAHDRIMTLRNKLIAHNAETDLIRTTMAVKEKPRILISHLITLGIPADELDSFSQALYQTEAFVELSLNKLLWRMEGDLGKQIIPE